MLSVVAQQRQRATQHNDTQNNNKVKTKCQIILLLLHSAQQWQSDTRYNEKIIQGGILLLC